MNITNIVTTFIVALIFLFFQIYLMSYMSILNVAIPFIFYLFLFMLPLSVPAPIEFAIGFITGLIVDISANSPGLNASALLFALGAKRLMIPLTASSNIRDTGVISLSSQNFLWYVTYLMVLIFVHSTAYFMLEAFSFGNFGRTLLKIITSTLYSFALNYIICITFYKK